MDGLLQQFRERILAAGNDRKALRIVGGSSKDWYGNALAGEPFHVRAYRGIVSYDPTELVITARCGTPLVEIEAALAQHRQMLAFEPPHFGPGATVGGMLASGLSGPRRASSGAVRDFVLGAVLMDGKGDILHFGGQVMKNVAGYDISRLLCGSMGMLGLVLEVSLKVLPQLSLETTIRFGMSQAEAIERWNQWGGQALPISASVWQDGVVSIRLSGARAAVNAAVTNMGGEVIDDAENFWSALREQRLDFFTSDTALWRLSVPSTVAPLAFCKEPLIEWGGSQRWIKADAIDIDPVALRARVEQVGGHATLFRGGDKRIGVFHPLAPAVAQLHGNLKNAFDPARVFNPGRMYENF